jgi:DNA-binding MarR family transcriptional regulator
MTETAPEKRLAVAAHGVAESADGLTESAARLRLAIVRTARLLRQEAAGAGGTELSPTAAAFLATVERHGPLTPSELAEIERVKRPTATRTLRLLTDAGLVDRAPDPTDGRSALVSVTAAGRERLRRLRGRKNAYLARRMRDLTPEDVEALERAAAVLEGMLESPDGERGGGKRAVRE